MFKEAFNYNISNRFILLDVLLCSIFFLFLFFCFVLLDSIAEYFYELCRILEHRSIVVLRPLNGLPQALL